MDRFIECRQDFYIHCIRTLKSNMDRFIADKQSQSASNRKSLKSNMDRFIVISLFGVPPLYHI